MKHEPIKNVVNTDNMISFTLKLISNKCPMLKKDMQVTHRSPKKQYEQRGTKDDFQKQLTNRKKIVMIVL